MERLRFVPVKRGVVKFVGKDASGKTSLKEALKRMEFKARQCSTSAIEMEVVGWTEGNKQWLPLNNDQAKNIFYVALRETADIKRQEQSQEVQLSSDARSIPGARELGRKALEEKIADMIYDSYNPKVLFDNVKVIVQVCDHGGQESFFPTIAPCISVNNCMYIMTFNVNEDLRAVAHSSVRQESKNGVQVKEAKLHRMKRNMDWINYHLSTISVSAVSSPSSDSRADSEESNTVDGSSRGDFGSVLACSSPPVIFAATHADQICGREEEVIRSQEAALSEVLRGKKFTNHVYRRLPGGKSQQFFCIDNTKSYPPQNTLLCQLSGEPEYPEKEEDSELIALRQLISSKIEEHCETHLTPVTWVVFEENVYEMRGLTDSKIIPLEQMVRMGEEKCCMRSSDVTAALRHLHDLYIVLYFSTCPTLQQVVFIDAQWVFTNLSRLNPLDFSAVTEGRLHFAIDTLQETGIMSQDLFDCLLRDLTIKERALMLKAAELLDMVTRHERDAGDERGVQAGKRVTEYLVPSALQVDDEVPVRMAANPVPLVLRPENVGMFIEALFFRLMNRCIRQFSSELPFLRRNHAIFYMETGCDIELFYIYEYVIVVMKPDPKVPNEMVRKSCVQAREFVVCQLEEVKQQGLAGFKFSVCFQHLTAEDQPSIPIQSDRLVSLDRYPQSKRLFYPNRKRADLTDEDQACVDIWFAGTSEVRFVSLLCGLANALDVGVICL